jgi:hypothetical protein
LYLGSRCARLGQQRLITITRLVTADTVEAKINGPGPPGAFTRP